MAMMNPSFLVLASVSLFFHTGHARWWHGGDGSGSDNSHQPPWYHDDNGGNGSTSSTTATGASFSSALAFTSSSSGQRALIAHAVIASAVWVLLVPSAGILLRLNIRSPWILRIHAVLQILSYLLYIAAASLGIYLVQEMNFAGMSSLWSDPHPQLGLAILALAFFQPVLGAIHHRIFEKRAEKLKAGYAGKAPGRTAFGHIHLWLGRILIILGMINGGLGIRLADRTPFQSDSSTRTAAIVYGTIAGVMALIYILIVLSFELQKAKRDRSFERSERDVVAMDEVPPSYTESQESLRSVPKGVVRYT